MNRSPLGLCFVLVACQPERSASTPFEARQEKLESGILKCHDGTDVVSYELVAADTGAQTVEVTNPLSGAVNQHKWHTAGEKARWRMDICIDGEGRPYPRKVAYADGQEQLAIHIEESLSPEENRCVGTGSRLCRANRADVVAEGIFELLGGDASRVKIVLPVSLYEGFKTAYTVSSLRPAADSPLVATWATSEALFVSAAGVLLGHVREGDPFATSKCDVGWSYEPDHVVSFAGTTVHFERCVLVTHTSGGDVKTQELSFRIEERDGTLSGQGGTFVFVGNATAGLDVLKKIQGHHNWDDSFTFELPSATYVLKFSRNKSGPDGESTQFVIRSKRDSQVREGWVKGSALY